MCAFASSVRVLPHTIDSNPHRRRKNGGGAERSGERSATAATMSAPGRPRRHTSTTHPTTRPFASMLAPPCTPRHTRSRPTPPHQPALCVPSRHLYVSCHTQLTRTHTEGEETRETEGAKRRARNGGRGTESAERRARNGGRGTEGAAAARSGGRGGGAERRAGDERRGTRDEGRGHHGAAPQRHRRAAGNELRPRPRLQGCGRSSLGSAQIRRCGAVPRGWRQ